MGSEVALESPLFTKGKRILAYMKDSVDKDVLVIVLAIEKAKEEMKSESPEIPGIIHLVVNYFKEKSDTLFECTEVRW